MAAETRPTRFERRRTPIIVEALDIVGHDSVFIGAKIHRAVDGRDRFEHDEEPFEDDPVQNDWNGSAKVALISVERSETAWQTIAAASSDPVATILADQLAAMREIVDGGFSARDGIRAAWIRRTVAIMEEARQRR